jgi:hypothetical protein
MVVRKLIVATTLPGQLGPLSMAAGDDVRLPGWDGRVQITAQHPYVPLGQSAWEMGAGADPAAKADNDYGKRTREPKGVIPSESTFVFVTPHVWAGKGAWEDARRAEGLWRDVRVIDGQILSEWFDLAPGVAAWFQAERGTPVYDIDDAESSWYRVVEEPLGRAVPAVLVIGGRNKEQAALSVWLEEPRGDLTIAGESPDEVVAFVIASVKQAAAGDPPVDLAPRVIVARDRDAVHYIGGLHTPHVVVVADPAISSELRAARLKNVHLVLPTLNAGRSESASDRIALRPLSRSAVEAELRQIGYSEEIAGRMARESRGSLQAVLWSMGSSALLGLEWLQEPEASLLAPLVLARRWPVRAHADHKMLEKLADRPYRDQRQTATEWRNPRGPLQIWGEMWDWKAWRTAWEHLSAHFTDDLVGRFAEVAKEVLGTRDPALDLDPAERWMAPVLNKVHPYSREFCEGLASSVAMFGALSDRLSGSAAHVAAVVARELLEAEPLSDSWLSLAPRLPDLAEAAPDVFIDAAEGVLDDQNAVKALFASGGAHGSHPHVYLLWALERLAWNPQLLTRVIVLLGRFAEIDPGGSLHNRPFRSLRAILLPWFPGTSASVAQRVDAFDRLRERCEDVAWKCGLSLLPADHETAFPTDKPRFRDWQRIEPRRPSKPEYRAFTQAVADRLTTMAGARHDRWLQLVGGLQRLIRSMPKRAKIVADALLDLDTSAWTHEQRRSVGETLRDLIHRHEEFPESDWSLEADQLDLLRPLAAKFEPDRPQDQHRRLFDLHPELPGRRQRSWQEELAALKTARKEAVEVVRKADGVREVIVWAADVESPEELGAALASCALSEEDESAVLRETILASGQEVEPTIPRRFGRGFVCARARAQGKDWGLATLRRAYAEHGFRGAVHVALALEPGIDLWSALASLSADLTARYWSAANFAFLEIHECEVAIPLLMEVGRPYVAIDHLARLTHFVGNKADNADYLARLSRLCMSVMKDVPQHAPVSVPGLPRSMLGHSVQELLDFIEVHPEEGQDPTPLLVKWEWQWLPVLECTSRGLRALSRELARSPELFIECLKLVYRGKSEPPTPQSDTTVEPAAFQERKLRANHAWKLLEAWRILPGLDLNSAEFEPEFSDKERLFPAIPAVRGNVDEAALRTWIDRARDLARAADRLDICDTHIGQLFAHAPADADGCWPCTPVRKCIEAVASRSLEKGLVVGIHNRRGAHFVGPTGDVERRLHDAFRTMAHRVQGESPRTAAVLRKIAEHYEVEAKERDEEGRREEFTDD